MVLVTSGAGIWPTLRAQLQMYDSRPRRARLFMATSVTLMAYTYGAASVLTMNTNEHMGFLTSLAG